MEVAKSVIALIIFTPVYRWSKFQILKKIATNINSLTFHKPECKWKMIYMSIKLKIIILIKFLSGINKSDKNVIFFYYLYRLLFNIDIILYQNTTNAKIPIS